MARSKVDEIIDQGMNVKQFRRQLRRNPDSTKVAFIVYNKKKGIQQVYPVTDVTYIDQNMEPIIECEESKSGIALDVQDDDKPHPGSKCMVVLLKSEIQDVD